MSFGLNLFLLLCRPKLTQSHLWVQMIEWDLRFWGFVLFLFLWCFLKRRSVAVRLLQTDRFDLSRSGLLLLAPFGSQTHSGTVSDCNILFFLVLLSALRLSLLSINNAAALSPESQLGSPRPPAPTRSQTWSDSDQYLCRAEAARGPGSSGRISGKVLEWFWWEMGFNGLTAIKNCTFWSYLTRLMAFFSF